MAKTDRYGHHADGSKIAERVAAQDYDFCLIAENIGYQYNIKGFQTDQLADKFFQGWKNSDGHRENMLDPDLREIGVGVAVSQDTSFWYAVQVLGRNKTDSLKFRIANRSKEAVTYSIGDKSYELPAWYARSHRLCRAAWVQFDFPNEDGDDHTQVEPESGDEFVIEKTRTAMKLKKQS